MFHILTRLNDPSPQGPYPTVEAAVTDWRRQCDELGVDGPVLLPAESLCLPSEVRLTLGWARDQYVVER